MNQPRLHKGEENHLINFGIEPLSYAHKVPNNPVLGS